MIDETMIMRVIATLKEIDVRGFDSMNRLVGLVMLFENVLQNMSEQAAQEEQETPVE